MQFLWVGPMQFLRVGPMPFLWACPTGKEEIGWTWRSPHPLHYRLSFRRPEPTFPRVISLEIVFALNIQREQSFSELHVKQYGIAQKQHLLFSVFNDIIAGHNAQVSPQR